MKKTYKMIDLDCANCAAKMEEAIKKIDGVTSASVSFMTQKMTVEFLTKPVAKFRLHAPVGSDGLVQCAVGQVRVQPQPRHRRLHRRRYTGRGRVWVFVGVELDKVVNF